MKNAKIVLVAEWDGWCGACAADRPLVLTRTGRQRLRTWLTGGVDDSRPLTLTCRLCGTGVDVPAEEDDPPVIGRTEEPEWRSDEPALDAEALPVATEVEAPVPVVSPGAVQPAASAAELVAGRQAVARALGALLAQRTAGGPVPAPALAPAVAPLLPMQRTPPTGALAELQLLADGIDLLSTGRA